MAGSKTMGTTLTITKAGDETEDLVIKSLTSIGELSGEREEIDVTTLDSPDGAKEYTSGAVDWGSQDVAGNITDATQLAKLRAIFDTQAVREFTIKTPAGNLTRYKAFIGSFKYGEKTTDGLDTFSITLRVTGSVKFNPEDEATGE